MASQPTINLILTYQFLGLSRGHGPRVFFTQILISSFQPIVTFLFCLPSAGVGTFIFCKSTLCYALGLRSAFVTDRPFPPLDWLLPP